MADTIDSEVRENADSGRFELDADIREICTRAARRFEELGCIVEEVSPDFGPVDEVFMALRSQQFVVDRELQLKDQRDKIKPDIIWNTELGFKQTTRQLAWAERERAALYRRMVEFWQKYDLLVTPSAPPYEAPSAAPMPAISSSAWKVSTLKCLYLESSCRMSDAGVIG